MKVSFKKYAIIWAILLVIFNALCFITPSEINGESKYTTAFWIGYAFITLAFIGQLACTYLAFKSGNIKDAIYNASLIRISTVGLVLMLIVGGITMVVPKIPEWVGVLACLLILAFTAITVIKAQSAVDAVQQVEKKIKTQTLFVRSISADAEALISKAESDEMKAEAQKVFDTIRYSDPMSDDALAGIESQIEGAFRSFKGAVLDGNAEAAKSASKMIAQLTDERNLKCRLLK